MEIFPEVDFLCNDLKIKNAKNIYIFYFTSIFYQSKWKKIVLKIHVLRNLVLQHTFFTIPIHSIVQSTPIHSCESAPRYPRKITLRDNTKNGCIGD